LPDAAKGAASSRNKGATISRNSGATSFRDQRADCLGICSLAGLQGQALANEGRAAQELPGGPTKTPGSETVPTGQQTRIAWLRA
jgi:hypothetical protein